MLARLISNFSPQVICHFGFLKCLDYRREPPHLAETVFLVKNEIKITFTMPGYFSKTNELHAHEFGGLIKKPVQW